MNNLSSSDHYNQHELAQSFLLRFRVGLAIAIIKNTPEDSTPEEFAMLITQDYVSNANKWKQKSQCLENILNNVSQMKGAQQSQSTSSGNSLQSFQAFGNIHNCASDGQQSFLSSLNTLTSNFKIDFSKISHNDEVFIGKSIISSLKTVLEKMLTVGTTQRFKLMIKETITDVVDTFESQLVIGFRNALRRQIIASVEEHLERLTETEYGYVRVIKMLSKLHQFNIYDYLNHFRTDGIGFLR